jgi:hypothetical protein
MFVNNKEMNNIKVEVSLKDLVELQENARLYFSVAEERDRYFNELAELRKKVEKFENKGV